jgi:hypothetical protein
MRRTNEVNRRPIQTLRRQRWAAPPPLPSVLGCIFEDTAVIVPAFSLNVRFWALYYICPHAHGHFHGGIGSGVEQ